jgi:uncharacterized protein
MTFQELFAGKREEILLIAARHGARNVRIFGSVARAEAGPDSDVDVLVDMETGRSLFDLGGLLMELQDLLGCRVDVLDRAGIAPAHSRARTARGSLVMRDDRERLLDIQEAIERIEKYAARGRETFERDELIQTWVLHNLQILGEAARAISAASSSSTPRSPGIRSPE